MSEALRIQSYRGTYTVNFLPPGDCVAAIAEHLRPGDHVIADSHVLDLYPRVAAAVSGYSQHAVTTNETAKSYDAIAPVIQTLIEQRFTKQNRLVAIGGGIIQDITAFTASILFRGVDWLYFPTNLLSQCDSCIGSKTSINFGPYKNQLGGFHPPRQIFLDVAFLDTLSVQEICSGLGEMMHYFLVNGEDDFAWAADRLGAALADRRTVVPMIHRSLSIKKAMIERDEFDQGPRNVFNYGHSFGHALESTTGFTVPHGIAVSYGMDLANLISAHLGLIPMSLRNRVRPSLAVIWENTALQELDSSRFLEALTRDKKNEGKAIKVILTRGLGDMFKTTLVLDDATRDLIDRFFRDHLYEQDL